MTKYIPMFNFNEYNKLFTLSNKILSHENFHSIIFEQIF